MIEEETRHVPPDRQKGFYLDSSVAALGRAGRGPGHGPSGSGGSGIGVGGRRVGFHRRGRLQRAGWADAITNPRVLGAIRSGGHRAIAVMFLEWAAIGCENVAVGWTRISDAASAQKFAQGIMKARRLDCWGGNAIGDAVGFATNSILTNKFQGKRKVIDVSGDGPNTLGQPILLARERALASGITINGLVIMDPERFFNAPGGGSLEDYYRTRIAGGPGSFVMVAKSGRNFRQAALAKLVREIANRDAPPGMGDSAVAAAPAADRPPE
jgi:hypothetical protein